MKNVVAAVTKSDLGTDLCAEPQAYLRTRRALLQHHHRPPEPSHTITVESSSSVAAAAAQSQEPDKPAQTQGSKPCGRRTPPRGFGPGAVFRHHLDSYIQCQGDGPSGAT
eukprot:7319639-Prymnesium_polylepis.1